MQRQSDKKVLNRIYNLADTIVDVDGQMEHPNELTDIMNKYSDCMELYNENLIAELLNVDMLAYDVAELATQSDHNAYMEACKTLANSAKCVKEICRDLMATA